MPLTYTPKQVQEMLTLPPSTLRRYASLYKDFLSQEARQPRRNYTEQDINVIAHIKDLSAKRLTVEEIHEQLQTVILFGDDDITNDQAKPVEDQPRPRQERQPENTRAIQPVEFFQNMIAELTAQHEQTLAAKDQHIDYLESEIKRLRTPWYKRLFGRYDNE